MQNFSIRKIREADISACGAILRKLPQWFGIEEAILAYEETLSKLDGFVAMEGSTIGGFVGLKRYGDHSIEIDVIAVLPEKHGLGMGHALLEHIEKHATTAATRLLHMKTLAPSNPDPNYAITRAFWEANGYIAMDAHLLWGNENPCQVMVKPVGRQP